MGTVPSPWENVLRETSAATSPLIITATATPTGGIVPLTVTFEGTATGGSPPYGFLWDFDDGTAKAGQRVNHTYDYPRNYTVELRVQDSPLPPEPPQTASTTLIVKAYASGFLKVRVVDSAEEAIPGATVEMTSGPEGQQLLTGTTDTDGTLDFGQVAATFYSLRAHASGYKTTTATIKVAANITTTSIVVLPLEPEPTWDPTLLMVYTAAGGAVAAATMIVLRRRKRNKTAIFPKNSKPQRNKYWGKQKK